jgi:catechol 2,3-dioxygenase-like lactoylglutathione lyase family enzyme
MHAHAKGGEGMHTRGISELIIKADAPEGLLSFYRDVVGLTPDDSGPESANWLWTGEPGKSARFTVNAIERRASLAAVLPFEETAPVPFEQRQMKPHFAFEVPGDRIEAAVRRLEARGVTVMGPVILGWMKAQARYFWDPEGHLVEFWTPLVENGDADPS